MCVYSFPFLDEINEPNIDDAVYRFNNYESTVEALDINDTEGLRNVIREIPLDNYRASSLNTTLLESAKANGETIKESTLCEDELIGLIQRLRRDDTGTGKTNLRYMSEFNPKRSEKLKDFQQILLKEKEREEKEYYGEDDEWMPYTEVSSNRFMNELDCLS